jgi:hypothetical protein
MNLAEALTLVWMEQDDPKLDAHDAMAKLMELVRSQRTEVRREIRKARTMGLDQYRKKVLP